MGYRWKPAKWQKEAYAEKMREAEKEHNFIAPEGPLRTGCKVTWVDKSTNNVLSGLICNHSYGEITGQHTFTVQQDNGLKKRVMGRNLYDCLLAHTPGEESREDNSWDKLKALEETL